MTATWSSEPQAPKAPGAFQDDTFESAKASSAAKAHQAVAHAAAMAVQDATDSLRNMTTVSTVAVGTILSQLVESGDPAIMKMHIDALDSAQDVATKATENFRKVGSEAAMILAWFAADDESTGKPPGNAPKGKE